MTWRDLHHPVPLLRPWDNEMETVALQRALAQAQEREEALRIIIRALLASLRPFGLNKVRFQRIVRGEAEDTPQDGPKAVRHAVFFQEAKRVLREGR